MKQKSTYNFIIREQYQAIALSHRHNYWAQFFVPLLGELFSPTHSLVCHNKYKVQLSNPFIEGGLMQQSIGEWTDSSTFMIMINIFKQNTRFFPDSPALIIKIQRKQLFILIIYAILLSQIQGINQRKHARHQKLCKRSTQ